MSLRCECDLIGCDGSHCLAEDDLACACGHRRSDHAQYRYSCFVRECSCDKFVQPDRPPTNAAEARQRLNRVVLAIMGQRPYGPVTLKDYLGALEQYEKLLGVASPAPTPPLDHYFTPDATKRFCTICGDNALGSVWGIHRFQIQPDGKS